MRLLLDLWLSTMEDNMACTSSHMIGLDKKKLKASLVFYKLNPNSTQYVILTRHLLECVGEFFEELGVWMQKGTPECDEVLGSKELGGAHTS